MKQVEFSLIQFQDALIERLASIDANGVGAHKLRSATSARAKARRELIARGYTRDQACEIVQQANDVHLLQKTADD